MDEFAGVNPRGAARFVRNGGIGGRTLEHIPPFGAPLFMHGSSLSMRGASHAPALFVPLSQSEPAPLSVRYPHEAR